MDTLGFTDRGAVPGMRASFLRCGMQGLDLFEMAGCDVHGGEEMNHMALNVEEELPHFRFGSSTSMDEPRLPQFAGR